MKRRHWCIVIGAFLALTTLTDAPAHRTSLTSADITVDRKKVNLRLIISAHDLAVALGITTDLIAPLPESAFTERSAVLARYLEERLSIRAQNAPCPPSSPRVDYALLPQDLRIDLEYICPEPIELLTVDYLLFFDIDASHRSLGRLSFPGGEEQFLFDRTLTRLDMEIAKPPARSWAARFGRVFMLGVEHILVGYDHILFLLALVIVSAHFWQLIKVASAFTVAHSFTLALAWYGIVDLPSGIVEIAIAVSIAYVALENIVRQGFGHRWLLAGGFGLIHGLGFYSALRDLGLGQTDAATTLLAFNLGVEAGQIAIIAAVYAPLVWWRRQAWYRTSARTCSVVILLAAVWWAFERIITSGG